MTFHYMSFFCGLAVTSLILIIAISIGDYKKKEKDQEQKNRVRDLERERFLTRQMELSQRGFRASRERERYRSGRSREPERNVGDMWMGDGFVRVGNFSGLGAQASQASARLDETMSELARVCDEYETTNPDPNEKMEKPIEPPDDFMLFDMNNKDI